MGLTYFKRFLMEIDVSSVRFSDAWLPPDHRLVAWNDSLLEAHAWVKYRCFCHEIDTHIFPSLGDFAGCLRLMRDIAYGEGFLSAATWLLVRVDPAKGGLDHCGTIQGVRSGEGRGSIQNFGIVPEQRGHGLGTALLWRSLEGFRSAGIGRVTLEVTCKNDGALRLYERVGFQRVRTIYKVAEIPNA